MNNNKTGLGTHFEEQTKIIKVPINNSKWLRPGWEPVIIIDIDYLKSIVTCCKANGGYEFGMSFEDLFKYYQPYMEPTPLEKAFQEIQNAQSHLKICQEKFLKENGWMKDLDGLYARLGSFARRSFERALEISYQENNS